MLDTPEKQNPSPKFTVLFVRFGAIEFLNLFDIEYSICDFVHHRKERKVTTSLDELVVGTSEISSLRLDYRLDIVIDFCGVDCSIQNIF